jgi:2-amino-4-hydroxy-6-hydroxymethyldihydropteridine diphosphokinase
MPEGTEVRSAGGVNSTVAKLRTPQIRDKVNPQATMILIAIGANLPGPAGPPRAQGEAALARLEAAGVTIVRRSRWYESAPVPASDQPLYINGVAQVATRLAPEPLLALLHEVEAALGRRRGVLNAARTLDLDLLDHDGQLRPGPAAPILPHPRLHERAFVLKPLVEIAPDWRHPTLGRTAVKLLAALPPAADVQPLP